MADYGFIIEPGTEREEYVQGGTERAAQVIAALEPVRKPRKPRCPEVRRSVDADFGTTTWVCVFVEGHSDPHRFRYANAAECAAYDAPEEEVRGE